ncbi:MAG: LysM peptidoglycan-binding domain-containing protein, partial [Microcystaceae cyanobacterium]
MITLAQAPEIPDQNCPQAVLSRLKRHRLTQGETVASLAQKYQLAPETLLSFNPQLKKAKLPIGQEILIPPFNGIRVEVPQGATWREVAKAYGMRADVLFEVNGCPANPKVIFIPGLMWTEASKKVDNYTGLS